MKSSAEQFSHITNRKQGQNICFVLLEQAWISLKARHPIQLCYRNEPACQDSKRQLVFPSPVFDRLEFVPAQFSLLILVATLHEIAMRFAPSYCFQRSSCAGIAEHIGDLLFVPADEQPFLATFILMYCPYQATAKASTKLATLVRSQGDLSPFQGEMLEQFITFAQSRITPIQVIIATATKGTPLAWMRSLIAQANSGLVLKVQPSRKPTL